MKEPFKFSDEQKSECIEIFIHGTIQELLSHIESLLSSREDVELGEGIMSHSVLTLQSLIDQVLPDGILWKESGLWMYFRNEDDFNTGNAYMNQGCEQFFADFIVQIIRKMKEEENEGIGLIGDLGFKDVHINEAIAYMLEQEYAKMYREFRSELTALRSALSEKEAMIKELEKELQFKRLA